MNTMSHYQHDFFQELSRIADLRVLYLEGVPLERVRMGWAEGRPPEPYESMLPQSRDLVSSLKDYRTRIHILSGYRNRILMPVVRALSHQGIAWAHWSERARPGLGWWLTWPEKRRYASWVNRHALCAFGVGSVGVNDLSRWGIKREVLASLPYSIAEAPTTAESTLPGASNGLTFLYVGSLSSRKATDILIRAFALVRARHSHCRLVLVGDDRTGGSCQQLARTLRLSDSIQFVGPAPFDRIKEYMVSSDVFVLPSRYDGWGVVLNEAANAGLALIGSWGAGASPSLVEPGVNGFCVEAGSVSSLHYAMARYAEIGDLSLRHGRASAELSRRHSALRVAERFVASLASRCRRESIVDSSV
jgi:glycosyltransferase involved in cell wall biosynthesis